MPGAQGGRVPRDAIVVCDESNNDSAGKGCEKREAARSPLHELDGVSRSSTHREMRRGICKCLPAPSLTLCVMNAK